MKVDARQLSQLSLRIPLPDGTVVQAVQDHAAYAGGSDYVWSGHLQGEPLSRVTFVTRRGVASGVIDRPMTTGNELYELAAGPGGDHRWYQHDPSKLPPCLHSGRRPAGRAGDLGGATAGAPMAAAAAADPVVVDVMIVYSPAARVRYGQAGIEAKILQALTDANTAFANSLVNLQYQLVYMAEIPYVETGDINAALTALQNPADGVLDSVHAVRNQVGADLVCLIEEDTNACGIGYVMQTVNTAFESWAFSVVYSGCLTSLTLSHEFGHNHGCQHDRANASFQGAFPYSYGWRLCSGDAAAFRSIMSYACTTVSPRVNYFSNPDLLYLGNPLGVDYVVDPANAADNARSLNETAITVASFRPSAGGGTSVPLAPSGLTANATAYNQIQVTWLDNATDEAGYSLERTTFGGTWGVVATLAAGTTTYADTSVGPVTTYTYRVRAQNAAGSSAYSNEGSATTPAVPPAAPSGLTAAAVSSSQINLAWVDNATTETGYSLERSADGVTFSVIATLGANTVSYSDTGRTANTRYYYRTRAVAGSVYSGYSAVASATTLTAPPAAPTNLRATVKSSTQIDLAWTDAASNESSYSVERSLDGVNFAVIATLAANSKSYSNTGLTPVTKYYYRVRAANAGGNSAYSAAVNATTSAAPPAAPSGLVATVISKSQINLTWIDNSTNETGFKVERSTNGTKWTQLATLGAGVTSYSSTGLTANTIYYYRVLAYNAAGNSAYTSTVTAKTLAQ